MRIKYSVWPIGLLLAAILLWAGYQRGYYHPLAVRRIFKTGSYLTLDLLANILPSSPEIYQLNVPFYRQEHALSCEIAALRMVLAYYGVKVEEEDLLARLPFDTFGPRDTRENIWGDPDEGFVGNIDGKIPDGGYGVYEGPVQKIAAEFRRAEALVAPELNTVLEMVQAGHPVIVWGTLASGRDISWKTREGKKVKAVFGEHTRIITGFKGSSENPSTIYLLDPVYGAVRMSKDKFLKNWAVLDRKAVVVF